MHFSDCKVREHPNKALLASTWSNPPEIFCCVYVSAKKALLA